MRPCEPLDFMAVLCNARFERKDGRMVLQFSFMRLAGHAYWEFSKRSWDYIDERITETLTGSMTRDRMAMIL